jgi:hypothetical protein
MMQSSGGGRQQTLGQTQWFAYRTDVSLRKSRRARTWLVWAAVTGTTCCGGAAVYYALVWLVGVLPN